MSIHWFQPDYNICNVDLELSFIHPSLLPTKKIRIIERQTAKFLFSTHYIATDIQSSSGVKGQLQTCTKIGQVKKV